MFGSGISYLTVDLIRIWKSSNKDDFAEKRDRYLAVENPPDASYYRQLDYGRMKKMIRFIDRNLDSVTPENEMKMEIYFNQDQPAFIDDEVNMRLFNFSYADKVYAFAQENGLRFRILSGDLKTKPGPAWKTCSLFVQAWMWKCRSRNLT